MANLHLILYDVLEHIYLEATERNNIMETLRAKKGFICDMDGVIYKGNDLLPGVKEFVEWLYRENKEFLFLTNSSSRTPRELQQKLNRMGLDVDESHFYTSALATAKFLHRQSPGCTAYVIGGPGLFNALHDAKISFNDVDPEYVVVGETNNYNYEHICRAMHHVMNGARLIGTNSDLTGPSETGIIPACRAAPALALPRSNRVRRSTPCSSRRMRRFMKPSGWDATRFGWGKARRCSPVCSQL